MKGRVTTFVAVIGILFLVAALAQRPHPIEQLAVYDSDGRRVGPVAGGEDAIGGFEPLVSFNVEGVPFMLFVFRDGLASNTNVVWESTDCSGEPFISLEIGHSAPSSLPIVAVAVPGSTVYVENGTALTVTLRSLSTGPLNLPANTPPFPPTCFPVEPNPVVKLRAVPARPLIDMSTNFKPPFTVR